MAYNVEKFLHAYLPIFFGEVSVQIFGPLLIGVFIFLLLSFKNSLCILDAGSLSVFYKM